MRIAATLTFFLVAGCYAERMIAPPTPAPSAAHVCIDSCNPRPLRTYLLIADGVTYRFPEDSAAIVRWSELLHVSEIENVNLVKGPAALQRYPTDGRPVIVITMKRSPTSTQRTSRVPRVSGK